MKRLYVNLLILFLPLGIYSQNVSLNLVPLQETNSFAPHSMKDMRKTAVYIANIGYSPTLFCDRVLPITKFIGLWGKIGFGYNFNGYVMLEAGTGIILGNGHHFLEIAPTLYTEFWGLYFGGNLGYRYTSRKGLTIKLGVIYVGEFDDDDSFPRLGIGYSF